MRIAIFASSNKLTRDLLEKLEPLMAKHHELVGTILFPTIPMVEKFITTFGLGNFVRLGLKEIPLKKTSVDDPNNMVGWVKNKKVDVILNLTGQIYRKDILEAPKICVLNKHSSLLPKYRGLFPVFWALLNGDDIGITIHKMSEKIDCGEIVLQKRICVLKKSLYECYKVLNQYIPEMFLESLEILQAQKYYGMPKRKDYEKFKRQGYKLI